MPWPTLTAEQQHNMDQAIPLIKEAARQEHLLAQKICGELYCSGHGVAEDERLAFAYTEKAALQGLAESQYVCAVRRCTGIGTEQDFDEARRFFKMAADQGDADAAEFWTHGRYGVAATIGNDHT